MALAEIGGGRGDDAVRISRPLLAGGLLLGGVMILVLAGSLGWTWWQHGRFLVATDDAYLEADIVPISSEVTGLVTLVAIGDNRQVSRGAILARIDDRDARRRVEAAAADIAGDEAALASLAARIMLQDAVIEGAAAQLAAAAADARFAGHERARYEQLGRSGVSSAERAEQAVSEDTRHSALQHAQTAALVVAQQQRRVLIADRDGLEATLRRHRTLLDDAQTQLERTVIRAPVDGSLGDRGVRVGALVQPGQQLFTLVPTQGLYVTANFKETQLRRIAPGQNVRIAVDTFPGTQVVGRVDSLAPASGAEFSLLPPENATGNFTKIIQRFPVRVRIEPNDPLLPRLRPGMSATVTIDTASPPSP